MIIGDVGGADSDRSEIGDEGEPDEGVSVGSTPEGVPDPLCADSSSRPSEAGTATFCIEY